MDGSEGHEPESREMLTTTRRTNSPRLPKRVLEPRERDPSSQDGNNLVRKIKYYRFITQGIEIP